MLHFTALCFFNTSIWQGIFFSAIVRELFSLDIAKEKTIILGLSLMKRGEGIISHREKCGKFMSNYHE